MKRTRRVSHQIVLPDLPADVMTVIFSHLKLRKASDLIHFSLISKGVTELTRKILLRGWAERFSPSNVKCDVEFEMMVSHSNHYPLGRKEMYTMLETKWETEQMQDHFIENLFNYQRNALERNWLNQKVTVEKIDASYSYTNNILRLVINAFYHDTKKNTVIALRDYPKLSIVSMTSSRDLLLAQTRKIVETELGDDPIFCRYTLESLIRKKNLPVLRADFYNLKNKYDDPLSTGEIYNYASINDVIIDGVHLFSTESPEIQDIVDNLYTCAILGARRTTNHSEVLLLYLTKDDRNRQVRDLLRLSCNKCIGNDSVSEESVSPHSFSEYSSASEEEEEEESDDINQEVYEYL